MSGAKGVAKGKLHERRTAKALRKVWGDAKRCLQYQRGHGAPDVDAGPLFVEVKARPVCTVTEFAKVARACRAAGGAGNGYGWMPALVQVQGAGQPALITLTLADLVDLALGDYLRNGGGPCPF